MKYDRRTRRKDRYVQGFDEILFFEPIPRENVELIGQWDEGIFVPNDSFVKYVKEEYKEEYMKILGAFGK
jgi:5-formaminoimidazole-4-carboxamide-1-beta-D-ribofuranosyl 5'-monophosphate synthetase